MSVTSKHIASACEARKVALVIERGECFYKGYQSIKAIVQGFASSGEPWYSDCINSFKLFRKANPRRWYVELGHGAVLEVCGRSLVAYFRVEGL